MTADRLTTTAVRQTKPVDKPVKLTDGRGLYLLLRPDGGRYWRFDYRFAGKRKTISLGTFPDTSLTVARSEREKARTLLAEGHDPSVARAEAKAAARVSDDSLFPTVAKVWRASQLSAWAPATVKKVDLVLDGYLIPALKRVSIATLTTPQAVSALDGIPPALAVKARGYLNNIVAFAIRKGLREDGRLLMLRGALVRAERSHISAAVDLDDVRKVIRLVADYDQPVTRAALTLAMLTAQRPGNVTSMEWAEIDLGAGEWSIPGVKMKMRAAHIVPLSAQALSAIRSMLPFSEGAKFVFPALSRQHTPHLHRDSLSAALRRMGLQGEHATHGFRAMFRTVARERLGIDSDVLEAQLAHAKRGDVARAYDRTQFLDERRVAMQRWANYLDDLRIGSAGNTLVALRRHARA